MAESDRFQIVVELMMALGRACRWMVTWHVVSPLECGVRRIMGESGMVGWWHVIW